MTRKDYELIAAAIRKEYDDALANYEEHAARGIQSVAERLADSLAAENPRFSRARFLTAAVRGDGPVALKSILTFR